MKKIITQTSDGSATLYIPELEEHYHSIKGAHTESIHVFIKNGLQFAHSMNPQKRLKVLEVGFGTGLNALLTLECCVEHALCVEYNSVELYPLKWEEVKQLNYSNSPQWELLHTCRWGLKQEICNNYTLAKWHTSIHEFESSDIDVVYFDAFAPEKQPDMWTETLFVKIYNMMSDNGVLTTYCAKGCVRRMLEKVGFVVERLEGPPGGKREILRAIKQISD